jgi:formamidopyrimidine-DNA glycosylase
MPELPEVETTRRGIAPWLEGRVLIGTRVRAPRLRWPIPDEIRDLRHESVQGVRRRAKFLLLDLTSGQLLLHLGMSGSLRVVSADSAPEKHDHLDLELDSGQALRLRDPRRFGAALWTSEPDSHPLLAKLGPEPWDEGVNGDWLYQRARGRRRAVKDFIMDAGILVGVGNIYAQESLFRAGIHPARAAGRISRRRYDVLLDRIRAVLGEAIEVGGTTLRDFAGAADAPGYFRQQLRVYGRGGEACRFCGRTLRAGRHGQRATIYCPGCQH